MPVTSVAFGRMTRYVCDEHECEQRHTVLAHEDPPEGWRVRAGMAFCPGHSKDGPHEDD